MSRFHLNNAKKAKNDEFYTKYEDVENEMYFRKESLRNKAVYCNCDNPDTSNFYKFFKDNFNTLELKYLTCTFYDEFNNRAYRTDYDGVSEIRQQLTNNDCYGEFDCPYCLNILKDEADIVITNPPFSKWRSYIDCLLRYNKDFIILGNNTAVSYKDIKPLILSGKIIATRPTLSNHELTTRNVLNFITDEGTEKGVTVTWYSNLSCNKPLRKIDFFDGDYEYDYYDNYDAIEVDSINRIPNLKNCKIGVPITILASYDLGDFKLIDIRGDLILDGYAVFTRAIIERY